MATAAERQKAHRARVREQQATEAAEMERLRLVAKAVSVGATVLEVRYETAMSEAIALLRTPTMDRVNASIRILMHAMQ